MATSFRLFLFFASLAACTSPAIKTLKFDSSAWKNGDYIMRGDMVDSLTKSGLLAGKTRREVVELLGEPDNSTYYQYLYRVDLRGQISWFQLRIDFDTITGKADFVNVHD